MKRHVVVRLSFQCEKCLKAVLNALKPETRRSPSSRSRTTVEEEDGKLVVSFEANDTSALRAAVNAYLRWISLAQNVVESVNNLSTEKHF